MIAAMLMTMFVIGTPDAPKTPPVPVWVDDDDLPTLAKRVEVLECQHFIDRIDIDNLESELIALRLSGSLSDKAREALQKRKSEILRRTIENVEKDSGARLRHCRALTEENQ